MPSAHCPKIPDERWARRACLLLAAGILQACCSGVPTDPREGGFAGGVCGTATSAYEQRLAERRETLDDYKALEASLDEAISISLQEAEDRQLQIAALTKELAEFREKFSRYRALDSRKMSLLEEVERHIAEAARWEEQAREEKAKRLEQDDANSREADDEAARRAKAEIEKAEALLRKLGAAGGS